MFSQSGDFNYKIMLKKCIKCGKEFKTSHKKNKYCSMKCYNPVLKVEKECEVCGKKFKVYRHLEKTAKFCSSKCYWKSLKGRKLLEETIEKMRKAKIKEWGKYKGNNRWYIKNLKHPNSDCKGYVLRYRLVAEKLLGRYLTLIEVIHHINGKSDDDRPENLYLFADNGKHSSYHIQIRKGIAEKLVSNLI